jgi:hypothetical protein
MIYATAAVAKCLTRTATWKLKLHFTSLPNCFMSPLNRDSTHQALFTFSSPLLQFPYSFHTHSIHHSHSPSPSLQNPVPSPLLHHPLHTPHSDTPNDFKHPNPTQSIHNFPSTQPCPYQHQLLPSHPRPELNPCPQTPSKHSTSAPQERPNYAADVDAVVVGSQDFAVDGESPDPILWGRG